MVVNDSDRSPFVTRVTSLCAVSFSHGFIIILDFLPSSPRTCPLTAIMFTIKATYRSETRKFTFSDSSFPTYSQIHEQVFPSLFLHSLSNPPFLAY